MDLGQMLNDSFEYTREALWEKWMRWLLLIIAAIIFPFFLGYGMEVLRGRKPAPEFQNWGRLFVDGLLLFVVGLIYAIPVIILMVLLIGTHIFAFTSGNPQMVMAAIGSFLVGMLVVIVVAIIVGLIAAFGYILFARSGKFWEAFNFGAILNRIGKIGWIQYIVALVVLYVVLIAINIILGMIPFIGWLLNLVLTPAYGIFTFRYLTLIYDSVPS